MQSRCDTPSRTGQLRLRVTRSLSGSIDGIQLDRFQAGYVYQVGTTVGIYLLAIGAAEPVDDDVPAIILGPAQLMFAPSATLPKPPLTFDSRPQRADRAEAADRPRKRGG